MKKHALPLASPNFGDFGGQPTTTLESLDGISTRATRATRTSTKTRTVPKRRRRMSAAARKRLSQLLKQRWASGKMKGRKKAA